MSASRVAHEEMLQWVGAENYLAKPFEMAVLLRRVEVLLGRA